MGGVAMLAETGSRQMDTVRDLLRAHTDATHRQLHLHSAFVDLFDGNLSLDGYRALVQRFQGFYAPLDQAIEQVITAQPERPSRYAYVRRSNLLAQDVADLTDAAAIPGNTAWCVAASRIVTPATLGGVLYVIEGATLGATQIDRAAQRLLGADGASGRRFWSWCRAQKDRRWKMANAYLDHLASQGVATEDLARGAQETFRVLSDWLEPLDRRSHSKKRATS